MNILSQRNFRTLGVVTIAVACFNSAFAQQKYKITDLGIVHSNNNFSMVMGLNNLGWAENMDGFVNAPETSTSTTIANGRAVIAIYGINIDLGTLGGKNSWTNYGGINDRGEAVGFAETSAPDPNGEDMCGFRTKLTCRPFLWRDGHMTALPTLGGNNGQAAAINNREQIVGISETAVQDSGCSPSKPVISAAFWERGEVRPLPTVAGDTDGFVQGINDRGQAVGSSGNCSNIAIHAVLWENDTAVELPGLGRTGNDAYAINDHGQAVGYVTSPDGTTIFPTVWLDGARGAPTSLGILPGDGAAFATGINNRGQVVGSTFNAIGWSHGFLWQDGVLTNLNSLISGDSNLSIIAGSNINERGQISGMATVMSGPDKDTIHAILLTPVNERIGR